MRYLQIALGIIKIEIYKLFLLGRLSYIFPIKIEKNVVISIRPNGKIQIGKHVSLNCGSQIAVTKGALLTIGNYSGIGSNNVIVAREKISIGNNVMIGPNVCIYDHDHVFRTKEIMRNTGFETSPVVIEDNVWIGAGVIVLRGVTIGSGSVIAAGTVVNKNIPKNSIVYNRRDLIIKNKFE